MKFGYGICLDKLFGFWKTLTEMLMCQWTISLEGQPAMTFIDKPPLVFKVFPHWKIFIFASENKCRHITVVEPGKLYCIVFGGKPSKIYHDLVLQSNSFIKYNHLSCLQIATGIDCRSDTDLSDMNHYSSVAWASRPSKPIWKERSFKSRLIDKFGVTLMDIE